jgi:hypothetical protein
VQRLAPSKIGVIVQRRLTALPLLPLPAAAAIKESRRLERRRRYGAAAISRTACRFCSFRLPVARQDVRFHRQYHHHYHRFSVAYRGRRRRTY